MESIANVLEKENQNCSSESYAQNQEGTGQVNQRKHGHFGFNRSDETLVNVRSVISANFFKNAVLPETLQPERTLKERIRALRVTD